MFEGEAYASYITLCRELRLERGTVQMEPWCRVLGWQNGDWYWLPGEYGGVSLYSDADQDEWIRGRYIEFREAVWLPRLDQWLAMLEEAGVTGVSLVPATAGFNCVGQRWPQAATNLATAPTREEAAARLWMAVTGRKA